MYHHRNLRAGALALAIATTLSPSQAGSFSGIGADSAALLTTVADFRTAIGGANNGANNTLGTTLTNGRREINWDAAALPQAMPASFFNQSTDFNGQAGSRRGALFTTSGSGFLVSANVASGAGFKFNNLDVAYETQFTLNSANRLFAANGSAELDTTFALPNAPGTAAGVTAFGAVFTDVDLANLTKIELFDANNTLLASAFAPVNDGGLSFVGIQLDPGQVAARVHITAGNLALGAGNLDGVGTDVVAMDDFIYSEPTALSAVPEPDEWAAIAGAGCLLGGVFRRLRRKQS